MSTWDTWEDCSDQTKETQTQTETEFTKNTIDSDQQKHDVTFKNVALSDAQNHKTEKNDHGVGREVTEEGGEEKIGGSDGSRHEYPLRPDAEDCAFFMKTGICKFKSLCKFNHPLQRGNQVVKEKEGSMEQTCDIQCKFYLTAGGCRFGEACKFRHSKDQDTRDTADLNSRGLPIRLGEKECHFYMRTGSCAYGAKCKFHHPDPSDIGAADRKKAARDGSLGKISYSWENHAGEHDPLPVFVEAKPPTSATWASPHTIMWKTASMVNPTCSYSEAVVSSEKKLSKEGSGHQTPKDVTEKAALNTLVKDSLKKNDGPMGNLCPTKEIEQATEKTQVNVSLEKNDGPMPSLSGVLVEEFPERPGQPECEPDPLPFSVEAKPPTSATWAAPHTIMCETASVVNPACNYPEAVVSSEKKLSEEGSGHQTPTDVAEKTALNTQVKDSLKKNDGPLCNLRPAEEIEQTKKTQVNVSLEKKDCPMPSLSGVLVEEFPERPGQLECDHYMKTGDCQFKSACRYHHPKNRASQLHIDPSKNRDLNQKSVNELENIRQKDPAPWGNYLLDNIGASSHRQQRHIGVFPERPGQPECVYFVKTGDCKYRYACRYHHPNDRHPTACLLNDKGLPLRPGSEVCNHYKRYGICKLGRRCSFDHPEDLRLFHSSGGSTPHRLSQGSGSSSHGKKPAI